MTPATRWNAAGSGAVTVLLILLALIIIIGGVTFIRKDVPDTRLPQHAEQGDSRAYYIAQTALDRSIRALVANPRWREGFDDVAFESGVYNVRVYDASNGERSTDLPPNYVRIVATSEVDGVVREVEAVWVDALSAFDYEYAGGNSVDIGNHRAHHAPILANVHNNAWHDGAVTVGNGATVYGSITTVGDIKIGDGDPDRAAYVYGDLQAASIEILPDGSIGRFHQASERDHAIDLNADHDTDDTDIERGDARVRASEAVVIDGVSLHNGESHPRVADAASPVTIDGRRVGPIVDPRPDFTTFYELASGIAAYPPTGEHVSNPLGGDGEAHYFASASSFTNWIGDQDSSDARCWRCGGEGTVGPDGESPCGECDGDGRVAAIEVTGVFYVDDAVLDLGRVRANLIVHGTIIVAEGNPYRWRPKTIRVPGGEVKLDRFPSKGRLVIGGRERGHFTQTYRSDEKSGRYDWNVRRIFAGDNEQAIAIHEPEERHAQRSWPALVAAERITIEPRRGGFADHPGDIGDEKLTILQGVVFAEGGVTLHGDGGWNDGPIEFDEARGREEDEELDEFVLNIDLDEDGDRTDIVGLGAITAVPVIPVGRGLYGVDIDADGLLQKVVVGDSYYAFFENGGYMPPALVYVEGVLLSQSIHACEQVLVTHDAGIKRAGVPFGFNVNFSSTTHQGLVSWWERRSR